MIEFIKENFLYGIIICLMVLLFILGYSLARMIKVFHCVEKMVDHAIAGELNETLFDESRLSRLENRIYEFLSQSTLKKHQMEEEREKIRELVGDISHQTKTPLANMCLYSQLLLEESLPEGTTRLAKQVENQSKKLEFLIGNLIKVSRLENNLLQFHIEKYPIDEILLGLQESFEEKAKEKGIILEVTKDPSGYVYCDKKWTLEALENIVDNGIKYTKPGGKIQIWTQATTMFLIVYVKDTGMGIREEEFGKIFLRFYRSIDSIKEDGVGIGLYLSRKIIGNQGGYIKVTSEYGKGSVFQVGLKHPTYRQKETDLQ